MTGMIRTLALGAVLAASVAGAAMAQGVNNTGYSRQYYGAPGPYGTSTWYDRQGYGGYGYAPGPNYGYAPAPYAPTPYAPAPYAPARNFGGGDNYGSSSPQAPGWWGNTYGPAQQAPWGYGGEYGYDAGFRSPSKY